MARAVPARGARRGHLGAAHEKGRAAGVTARTPVSSRSALAAVGRRRAADAHVGHLAAIIDVAAEGEVVRGVGVTRVVALLAVSLITLLGITARHARAHHAGDAQAVVAALDIGDAGDAGLGVGLAVLLAVALLIALVVAVAARAVLVGGLRLGSARALGDRRAVGRCIAVAEQLVDDAGDAALLAIALLRIGLLRVGLLRVGLLRIRLRIGLLRIILRRGRSREGGDRRPPSLAARNLVP